MMRATPREMRKTLEVVHLFNTNQILFVPVPVSSREEMAALLEEVNATLEAATVKAEAEGAL